jgi:hypothetical protein
MGQDRRRPGKAAEPLHEQETFPALQDRPSCRRHAGALPAVLESRRHLEQQGHRAVLLQQATENQPPGDGEVRA